MLSVFFRERKNLIEAKEKWIKSLLLSDQGSKGLWVIDGVATGISLN